MVIRIESRWRVEGLVVRMPSTAACK